MHAAQIRSRFLICFPRQSRAIRATSALVAGDDSTDLFTDAGMVQVKEVFLGQEQRPEVNRRAPTSLRCVLAYLAQTGGPAEQGPQVLKIDEDALRSALVGV